MLGDRLPAHRQPFAQLAQRLAAFPVQPVQQLTAAGVCQGAEDGVLAHGYYYATKWLPVKCRGVTRRRPGTYLRKKRSAHNDGGLPMNFIVDFFVNGPERLSAVFAWLPPLFARIAVGWVFLWSGWGKLNALPFVTQNFREWGIPVPEILAPFVSGVEFFGGLLLLLGLFTRVAAVPLVIVMIVAIISAKLGDIDSAATLLGFEEVLYMALFGWLAVAGPGPVSLDHLLQRWRQAQPA
jgi:putative oxidoreductase